MNKENRKILTEKAEKSEIWLLEMRVSRQNKLLIELKAQGVNSQDSKWRNIRDKRNLYRRVLLKKLIEWKEGKILESNPDYNDYLDYQKDKENNEFDITKKEEEDETKIND
jgi:hypothetical protein